MNLCHAKIEGDTIQPPHYEVVFSQNDNEENNFALANLISREKQCLFTFANEEITAWVSELLTALQNNKSVTYEDFGTFMLDKKGNITFESAVIPQLNSLFEGLEPIDLKHFEIPAAPVVEPEPEPVEEPEPEPVVEPVGANNISPINDGDNDNDDDDDDEDDEDDDNEEEEEEIKKRHSLAWLWVVLLLLVVLGVLGYIFKDKLLGYYQQWKDRKQPVEQVVVPNDNADATATVDEKPVGANNDSPVNDSPEETVAEPEPEPVTYTPAVVKQSADGKYDYIRFEKGHYYAIAGSFPSESDVIRHIRQKKLDQYSPKILKQDGVTNLRVCIGVFNTEEEAESFAKGVNSSYWVLK